jgi:mono/diheme cytochrome c family protein
MRLAERLARIVRRRGDMPCRPSFYRLMFASLLFAGACSKDSAGGPLPAAPAPSASDLHGKTRPDPAAPAPSPPAAPPLSAEQIFATRCSTCHGVNGKGDGPASAALNPKPRNYTDPAWQRSVTDDHIRKTILEGGAAVGKSPLMVPNPDLVGHPDVVDGLVKIVRGFGS